MSRSVPYNADEVCDICGRMGAFDFMGDLICPTCLPDEEFAEEDPQLELDLEDEDDYDGFDESD